MLFFNSMRPIAKFAKSNSVVRFGKLDVSFLGDFFTFYTFGVECKAVQIGGSTGNQGSTLPSLTRRSVDVGGR